MRVVELPRAEGPILIFLHGFPDSSRLWEAQLRHFAPAAHLVCLDLAAEDHDVEAVTLQVLAVVRRLRRRHPDRRLHLVGHDLGCFILNEVCLRAPHCVDGQVLINGAGIAQFTSRLGASGARRSWSQSLRSLYVLALNAPGVAGLVRAVGMRVSRRNFAPIMLYRSLSHRAWRLLRSWEEAPCLVPTVLVSGRRDPFLIVPCAAEIRRFFTRASHVVLPTRHWSPLTHPADVNDIIATATFAARSA